MSSSGKCNGAGEEEAKQLAAEFTKTLKEGERILAPTRRPDGTLRKPIRFRAGYVPQDEVPVYQSRGALMKKEMEALREVPPGFDQVADVKPKSKSAKRNERKREKRQQAAVEKDKSFENDGEDANNKMEPVESVASQMNELSISVIPSAVAAPSDSTDCSARVDLDQDIDKKIRALKKKIRQTEAQQQKAEGKGLNPEQLEKVSKLEGWREELKLLEYQKAELAIPS